MAGMGDINELLGDQAPVDESQLPDSGTTDADLAGDPGGEHADNTDPTALGDHAPAGEQANRRVPLSALQEERARRQELQAQVQQQAEMQAKMQERFQQFMERMQPQQPAEQQPAEVQLPAFIDDPEAHLQGLRQVFEQQLSQQAQQIQQLNQYIQQQAQVRQLASSVEATEKQFRATVPDYQQAADFFANRKAAEYTALGLDPATVQQQVARDYQGLALAAQQRGASAPEMLYNLAKAMGYTPQQAAAAAGTTQAPAGKAAPTSLANLQGAPRAPDEQGGLSLESIATMSDAEFEKVWKDLERTQRQRPKI